MSVFSGLISQLSHVLKHIQWLHLVLHSPEDQTQTKILILSAQYLIISLINLGVINCQTYSTFKDPSCRFIDPHPTMTELRVVEICLSREQGFQLAFIIT
jgi:hypothetical protein